MKANIKLICSIVLISVCILGLFFVFYEFERKQNILTLYGNVDIRQVNLGFRVHGRVNKMFFDEGEVVSEGDLIATLDSVPLREEVQQAKGKVNSIKASLDNANLILQRRKETIDSGAVSKEDYDDAFYNVQLYAANLEEAVAALESAKTRLHDTKVYAPTEGTILTRVQEPGAVVNIGDPVYTLSILSPVWVRTYVTETNLGNIYPGMKAKIYTDTQALPVYEGHIGFISPVAEFTPKSVETTDLRTDLVYRLRVVVNNPDKGLKQGMPVTVTLDFNSVTN